MDNRLCMSCKPCKDQLDIDCDDCKARIREEAERSEWHIVKYHNITEEEREKEGYPDDWKIILDCIMPDDDGEEILIATRYKDEIIVDNDIAMNDGVDGFYLESGIEWTDVVAWREMPQFDEKWLEEKKND